MRHKNRSGKFLAAMISRMYAHIMNNAQNEHMFIKLLLFYFFIYSNIMKVAIGADNRLCSRHLPPTVNKCLWSLKNSL